MTTSRPIRLPAAAVLAGLTITTLSAANAADNAIADGIGELSDNLQIHGFASQGVLKTSANNYLSPDSRRGTADFNEFGLNVSDRVTPDLTVGLQLFARDLGNQGNDTLTLDWAYGDYHWRDWLGLRAGKIRLPLGLYNESRDLDLARTEILLPQMMVYNEAFRDVLTGFIGAELYGNLAAKSAGSVDYTIYAGGMQVPDNNSISAQLDDNSSLTVSHLSVKELWGGQATWNTPLTGLRIGGSFYRVDWGITGQINAGGPEIPTTMSNRTTIEVASAEYTWHDLTIASECDHERTSLVDDLSFVPENDVMEDDWYILAAWRFNRWFAVAGSYTNEHSYGKYPGAIETQYQKDTAVSLRFDPDPHWLIKAECHYMIGDADLLTANNPSEMDASGNFHPDQHWWLAAAKTTFSF